MADSTTPVECEQQQQQQQQHPFADVNEPFAKAVQDSHARGWSFHKGDIAIDKFVPAITAFLNIFDALGARVITDIVRKDFRSKTNGLVNASKRLQVDHVRDVVRRELQNPPRFWMPSGIESLLWAHRVMSFVEQMVARLVEDPNVELHEACLRAYRATLAIRHPQVTRAIFEKALMLVPKRSVYVANLMRHDRPSEDDFRVTLLGMKDFLRTTRPFIEALRTLFDMEQIDDLPR